MAERSFEEEVRSLRLKGGEEFRGEGILAVTKALLQSGVSYVGGYQGAPISHLMDVLADSQPILDELGVHFEASASEATAAAMLAASINYPLRGAVTWKSTVGTNVASDALSNLASAGVKGGALIVLGEDYGEGASIMQERTHAFAMKSQMWLLDPRPNLPAIVKAVEQGFELSEASNTPVMLMLRIRACHVYGSFTAKDNRAPAFSAADALASPTRDYSRIILPPSTYAQEKEKIESRLPAALRFITERGLNEILDGERSDIGIILQGGLYNGVLRALHLLGQADIYGASRIPLSILNVTYPLIPDEIVKFCAGKRAVLVVEESQPDFIEQQINQILRQHDVAARIVGKGVLPMAGEYTGDVLKKCIGAFLEQWAPAGKAAGAQEAPLVPTGKLAALIPARPSGLCTGCPERPLFAALKILQRERGALHISSDIGCHSFATLPPFNMGNSIMGYGLGPAGASALSSAASVPGSAVWAPVAAKPGTSTAAAAPRRNIKRPMSIMGDGGFWHNGLTSGIGNAVFNRHDTVTIIVDNGYSAATGGQDILSSKAMNLRRETKHSIIDAVRGIGVRWVRRIGTYDMKTSLQVLREALSTDYAGPKVILAEGECQLNRQRRIRPLIRKAVSSGKRVVRQRFGVDADTCTGDHSCIRLSGCPSLTIKANPDPLRTDPVAHVDNSCVGCGVCGEVAHAAVLCPSFYRADIVHNPSRWDRWAAALRTGIIRRLQRRADRRRLRYAV
jgi:indolepyruvate ferredoxin oxidoreductase alpha subunit